MMGHKPVSLTRVWDWKIRPLPTRVTLATEMVGAQIVHVRFNSDGEVSHQNVIRRADVRLPPINLWACALQPRGYLSSELSAAVSHP